VTDSTQLGAPVRARGTTDTCLTCGYFAGAADEIERRLPGLRTLGSVYGSVRGADGLCRLHDRYLAPSSSCLSHELAEGA
jgi:hypothetical protein